MIFQFNSDNQISGHEELAASVEEQVNDRLGRFSPRLTRVEVHVGDENGPRSGGNDIRCSIEARPENARPVAVVGNGPTVEAATRNALGKMVSLLDSNFGKQRAY